MTSLRKEVRSRNMWLKVFLMVLGIVIVVLVGAVLVNKSRLDKANTKLVDELLADASSQADRVFRREDLEGLPRPVQRYLGNVLTEGQPYVRTVRLQQRGEFRLGDATAPWKPLNATQHFTVDPPNLPHTNASPRTLRGPGATGKYTTKLK